MDNLSLIQGGNLALTSSVLAAGTNAGTIKTTATLGYTINGEHKSKAATDNIAVAYAGNAGVWGTPSNGSFTGEVGGSTRIYGLFIDGAGAVSVEPGQIVNSAKLAAGEAPLQFPATKRDKACFGALRIAVTAGTTFIPGTTAFAGGVTASFLNLAAVPAEPLKA